MRSRRKIRGATGRAAAGWIPRAGPGVHAMTNSRLRIAPRAPRRRSGAFSTIEEAVAALRDGRMIVVVDDEDRENEGDLTLAADKVTPEAINFMITHGRGLVCLAMTGERLDELDIPLVVADNSSRRETPM